MDILAANMAQYSAAQFQAALPKDDPQAQLKAVAIEFESLFTKQMLDSMRATLSPDDDLFYGGMAQDIFQDMLYEEYARMMAKTGSLGVADLIYSQYEQTL
jgi:peptidoglycan hydrolase FlgJ